MSKRFLVFQHTTWDTPGKYLLKFAKEQSIKLEVIQLWNQDLPSFFAHDALIVLGREPQNLFDNNHPFIEREKEAIQNWLSEDRPYLGIGHGHHLLAESLGATIADNYCASIGFVDGFLTHKGKEHPLFKKIPPRCKLFKWHTQAVMEPVPRNIAILATSAECQIEAISVKGRPHIVGVQFSNNTASLKDIESYLHKSQKWLASFKGKYINPATIISDAKKNNLSLARQYNRIFNNFVKLT